jgi:hypothetical protein
LRPRAREYAGGAEQRYPAGARGADGQDRDRERREDTVAVELVRHGGGLTIRDGGEPPASPRPAALADAPIRRDYGSRRRPRAVPAAICNVCCCPSNTSNRALTPAAPRRWRARGTRRAAPRRRRPGCTRRQPPPGPCGAGSRGSPSGPRKPFASASTTSLQRTRPSPKARGNPFWVMPAGVWALRVGGPDPKLPSAPWSQESDNYPFRGREAPKR